MVEYSLDVSTVSTSQIELFFACETLFFLIHVHARFGKSIGTFTGYINRIRGYHSQNAKAPGYEMGELPTTYYYATPEKKLIMHKYAPLKGGFFNREYPGKSSHPKFIYIISFKILTGDFIFIVVVIFFFFTFIKTQFVIIVGIIVFFFVVIIVSWRDINKGIGMLRTTAT